MWDYVKMGFNQMKLKYPITNFSDFYFNDVNSYLN